MPQKKSLKPKEPVKVRLKPIANGNQSIYLDINEGKGRRKEYLKMYLVPEVSHQAKIQNENTMRAVNAIKAQRILDITNKRAGINSNAAEKISLTTWIECFKSDAQRKGCTEKYTKTIGQLNRMISQYGGGTVQLREVSEDFCKGFISFLNTYVSRYGKHLSPYTIYLYHQCLIVALNAAVDTGIIPHNPCHDVNEKPKTPETTRTSLSVDDVKKLEKTECFRPSVKMAFLFACFCGMRYSDLINLSWGDIRDDNGTKTARIFMHKTGKYVDIPLSPSAISWMPDKGDKTDSDPVFDMPSYGRVSKILKQWAKDADVEENVTFLTSRHTFATIALAQGNASIYEVCEMLGHKYIRTTKIYADTLKQHEIDALNRVSALFTDAN